jgi:hypothetical protein
MEGRGGGEAQGVADPKKKITAGSDVTGAISLSRSWHKKAKSICKVTDLVLFTLSRFKGGRMRLFTLAVSLK